MRYLITEELYICNVTYYFWKLKKKKIEKEEIEHMNAQM